MDRLQKAFNGNLPIQKAFRELIRLRRGILRPIERKYAEGIAKVTGLPLQRVLKSRPFKKYQQSLEG